MKRSIISCFLPVGFRFNPTDEEIVKHYLKGGAATLPCLKDIEYCDVYGDKSPWEIFQLEKNNPDNHDNDYGENIFYVYTKLKKASPNRISRVAGCGTWQFQKRPVQIYDADPNENDNVVIGIINKSKTGNEHQEAKAKAETEAESSGGYVGSNNLMIDDNKINQFELGLQADDQALLKYGLALDDDAEEVTSFARNNEDDVMLLDDELEPILHIDTKDWNLTMLQKYFMDDDDIDRVDESSRASSSVEFANYLQNDEGVMTLEYSEDFGYRIEENDYLRMNEVQQPAVVLQESEVDEFIEELLMNDVCDNQ
ncbi:NAC domain-containing protein 102 [Citrus clementina]|uniref:NAC domain-containing protein 102 n=1 Tax=Citrus clementina TaxID=85681 RepID=UPI000CED623F|nr:NAC domain-containing protein 102 [Citrus x clementina]